MSLFLIVHAQLIDCLRYAPQQRAVIFGDAEAGEHGS